jgi:predicted DNA-binding protein (MmcQ/YjbR family)
MTKEGFLGLCSDSYGTLPDYPFENDSETAVFRHTSNKKWFAILMKVPSSKFGIGSDVKSDVVNVKIPIEIFGSFSEKDGVYPAYHMNKAHWVSIILEKASFETVDFLLNASYFVTKKRKKQK